MHELYELKEKLCEELKEYGEKDLTTGSLDVVDKLAHTVKNLGKIIEMYEEEDGYSNRDGRMYDGNRGGFYRRMSYARGRGRNAKRDSRGRYSSEGYSRADDMIEQLKDLMDDVPNEQTRQEINRLISKMENMM